MTTRATEPPEIPVDETRTLKLFLVSSSLVAALCITSGFLGSAYQARNLIREEMLNSARRDFENIVLMRRWNAELGGVYALKRPGVESNPYLENPDITATDGKVYTKKNPALMTREISEMFQKEQGSFFHITSLTPLNPGNRPDAREREALKAFEAGTAEATWEEPIGGLVHYRYMAPLKVEASCLECHAKQGYRLGDIRGGISVSFRISDVEAKLWRNGLAILALASLTIGLVILSFGLMFRRLVSKLDQAREALRRMAMTDSLTGLRNRHVLLQRAEEEKDRSRRSGEPLGIVMIDLDHFKSINDAHGHPAGDTVLQETADILRASIREYDVAARFGGEEFLLLLPGSALPAAQIVAERIRAMIESGVRAGSGEGQRIVTASFGVAGLQPGEEIGALIRRVDAALYRAKSEGRNRVVADEA